MMKPPSMTVTLLLLVVLPALAHATEQPARIDVFITSKSQLTGVTEIQVHLPTSITNIYTIDGIGRLEAILGKDLPANIDTAGQLVLQRMRRFGRFERDALQHSADALVLAWQYQVQRYPAIVFDRRWVIYGVTDLAYAHALFQKRRGESSP